MGLTKVTRGVIEPFENYDVNNINATGIVTAATFIGNGSGITGVTASGVGIEIKDSGSIVGVAGTIDFSTNLNVSPVSAGIVTVTVGDTDLSIADKIVHTGDTNTAIRFPDNDTFTVETAGAERLRIDSGGNVGIGTDSPAYKLTLAQGNTASVSAKSKGDNTSSRAVRYIWSFDDGDGASINGVRTTGSSASDVYLSFRTGGITNSEERMRINSSGNIGIGENDPISILHIEKFDATVYDDSATDGQVSVGPTIYLNNGANANNTVGGQIVFGMRSTEAQARIGATGGVSPALTFGTADAERMRINSSGNVGIGTDTPAETLSVAGNVRVENSADASQYLNLTYQGIDFQNTGAGSSTTATSHILDDYEEGTFDAFATVAGSFTGESTRTSRYTRIGNLVYCDLRVLWTGTTGTSPLRFNLPFAQAGTTGDSTGHTGIVFYAGTSVHPSAISAHVSKGSSTVAFYDTDGGSFNPVTLNDVNGSYDWIVSFSYFVA